MKSFAIYGASDDLVEQQLDGKDHDETGQPRSFIFVAGKKSLHAKVSFNGKAGTGWKISVEIQDDDETGDLPFDVRIAQHNYSPKLIVDNAREPVTVISRNRSIGVIEASSPLASTDTKGE